MASNDDVVTGEAEISQGSNSTGDLAANSNWIRGSSDKVGDSNKDALTFGDTLSLDFLSDGLVAGVVAQGTLDPNDGNIGAS